MPDYPQDFSNLSGDTLRSPSSAVSPLGERWPITFSPNLTPDFTHYLSEPPEMTRHDEPSKKAKTMNANIMKNPPPLLSQNYMNPRFQPKTSFRTHEKSLFLRQNDYWIIRYHGQTALLKSTRGLQYLAILLSDPGREFHVSELIAGTRNASTQAAGFVVNGRVTDKLYAGITMLDTQAKAEYKSHLNELRRDLDEAERFHDPVRQSQAQNEIHVITDRLASAVGFGGRDRKTSSDAERARSAVTKCIKKAVQKIGELNPSLGYHFAARIKTGYFCSYNPRPDRPAAWEVLPATSDFSTTFDFVTPKSHSVTPKVTP